MDQVSEQVRVSVVATAEATPRQEVASAMTRPAVELPGALQWLRQRTRLVYAGPAAVTGLLLTRLTGQTPTVTSIGTALAAEEVLECWRGEVVEHLARQPSSPGFGPAGAEETGEPPHLPPGDATGTASAAGPTRLVVRDGLPAVLRWFMRYTPAPTIMTAIIPPMTIHIVFM